MHNPPERFSCMTEAVDVLTKRYASMGLSRRQAYYIVMDLDMGPVGSDRGIWLDPLRVGTQVMLCTRLCATSETDY